MVHVVGMSNRGRFRAGLADMHRDRGRVVSVMPGHDPTTCDVDQFDTPSTLYLIEASPRSQRHMASVRALPSLRPHVIASKYPHLCETPVPAGPDVWEVSQFCVSPDLGTRDRQRLRGRLYLALAEFAIAQGIRHYMSVTPVPCLPEVMAAGWHARPLGLPRVVGGQPVGAILYTLMPDTLETLRAFAGSAGTVLESGAENSFA